MVTCYSRKWKQMHSYTVSVASYMNLSFLMCSTVVQFVDILHYTLHILTPGLCFFITIQPQRKAGINWKTPIILDYKEWQIFRCSQLEGLNDSLFCPKETVSYISNLECHWQLTCWPLFFIYVMHHQLWFSPIFMPSNLLYTLLINVPLLKKLTVCLIFIFIR